MDIIQINENEYIMSATPAVSQGPPYCRHAPVLIFGLLQEFDPHVRNGHSHAIVKPYTTFTDWSVENNIIIIIVLVLGGNGSS